jgi:hypothetical protein
MHDHFITPVRRRYSSIRSLIQLHAEPAWILSNCICRASRLIGISWAPIFVIYTYNSTKSSALHAKPAWMIKSENRKV